MSNQLVVIDPSVANYQSLIDQLGSTYSYLLLYSNSDGVKQQAKYVATNPGYDAIHLISHGSPGQVVRTLPPSQVSLRSLTKPTTQVAIG